MLRTLVRWIKADEAATDDRGWAVNLAIFRIVLFGALVLPSAWGAFRWTDLVMPALPRGNWVPVSFFAYLPFDVLTDSRLAWWLALANLVLVVLAFFGVFTRWTIALATVLSLYVFGLMHNLGKVSHNHHLIWFMALTAVGPSGRFLSVDALLAAIWNADRGQPDPPAPPGTALATFRCIWILFGLIYLAPGAAKLVSAITQDWASAENLRLLIWSGWFYRAVFHSGFAPPLWIEALPSWLISAGGLGVIVFEVGFVWLVLFRPVRPFLAVAGLLFHLTNGVVLGVWFRFLLAAYAGLIDWVGLGRVLGRWLGVTPLVVLYDDDCWSCRRAIAMLRSLDVLDRLVPVARSSGHDLCLIGGAPSPRGFDRYRAIAWRFRWVWPLAGLMALPGVAARRPRVHQRAVEPRLGEQATGRRGDGSYQTRGVRWVVAVGAALIVGQASVSSLQDLVPKWLTPEWPFDRYPEFTKQTSEVTIWEARAVLKDGREVRLSGRAWMRAFGAASRSKSVSDGILRSAESDRRRRSLEVADRLWRHETPEVRSASVSVAVYEARYAVASNPRLIADTLLYRFPVDGLGLISHETVRPSSRLGDHLTR